MKKLIDELQRRHVWKTGVAYCVLAWLLMQVADVILPNLGAPDWVLSTVIIVLIIGLPLAIFLSWVYDLTPPEIIRTASREDFERNESLEGVLASLDSLPPYPLDSTLPVGKSLAIMPLKNLSPVEDHAFFADGIHEEILNQLSKISDIRVLSRSATQQFRSSTLTPAEIARKLRVQQLLEGSVRFAGNKVRIIIDLVEAATNTQVWSESYESELDDIFSIQSDVAVKVANAMKADLEPDELARINQPATTNLEAYTLFLRAITREKQGNSNIAEHRGGWVESGIQDMERVIELDPGFARAYAHLGWLQTLKRFDVFPDPGVELLKSAEANANKALEIDPHVIRAYSVLGFVAFERHQYDKWEELERKAIGFPGAKAGTYINFGDHMGRYGRFQEAYELFDRAIELDPLRSQTREYATYYRVLGGDYEDALKMAEYFLASGGTEEGYHLYRAITYALMDELDKSREELALFKGDFGPLNFNCPILWAYTVTRTGGGDFILSLVEKAKTITESWFLNFGRVLALNDLDAAFAILDGYMPSGHVVSDMGPLFYELKKDPRWEKIRQYIDTPTNL